MLYVPETLAKSQPCDFSTSYNPTSTPPQTAQNLREAQDLRNNFWNTFTNIQQQGDHVMLDNVDWMALLQYMNKTPDLLEFSQQANFPYQMQWESGAFPGSWHTV